MLRSALTAAALAVFLVVCAPAHAALRVPVVPGIAVVYGPCPMGGAYYAAQAGCTWVGATSVYVATPGDRWIKWHELGHQFAFRVLGDVTTGPLAGAMLKFAHVTRPRVWGAGARSAQDVREQFADAYAACALGRRARESGPWGDPYRTSPRVQRNVCAMIVRAGAGRGL